MAIELSAIIAMGSSPESPAPHDKESVAGGDSTTRRRRRRRTAAALVLALSGVTGLVASLTVNDTDREAQTVAPPSRDGGDDDNDKNDVVVEPTKKQDDGNNAAETPLIQGTTPLPPTPSNSNGQEDNTPSTKAVHDDDVPRTRGDDDGSDDDTAMRLRPHDTCATAVRLEAPVRGHEVLSTDSDGHADNPTPAEAAAQACRVDDRTTAAVYYTVTAATTGPLSVTLERRRPDPVLVSVLRGDSCDALTCVGYDYDAMTWEATRSGQVFIIMVHQVVGEVSWYLWTHEQGHE